MSICELIFNRRRFPEKIDDIEKAYKLKEKYDKKAKSLKTLYSKDSELLYPKVMKCVSIYDKLIYLDPNISDYLLTNKAYNLKRKKAIDKIHQDKLILLKSGLEILDEFDSYFSDYKFSVSKTMKLVLEVRKIGEQIKNIRDNISEESSNPEKYFRSLYKIG